MRIAWAVCFVAITIAFLSFTGRCQGTSIKLKFRNLILKIRFLRNGKKISTPETFQLSRSDQEQWRRILSTMNGSTPEENIDNTTSSFDRILVMNAYSRTNIDDGNFLYQGDMLMYNDSLLNTSQTTRRKRAVTAFEFLRWRNNRIPYKLHPSLSDQARRVILGAMKEWERSVPCIKWQSKSDSDIDFVHFYKGQGCFSGVGRYGGEQRLSIGLGCEDRGIALHEMGHTLGLYHEQSRPDRDDYIDIVKENILEGFDHQFQKFNESVINSYGVPYDYVSIMHYSATSFAKKRGLVTIRAVGKREVKFGQIDQLSDYDVKQVRAMYGCQETEFVATPTSTEESSGTLPVTEGQTIAVTTPATTRSQPSNNLHGGKDKNTTIKIKEVKNLIHKLTNFREFKNDNEQWERVYSTMNGSTFEECMTNAATSFDQLLVINSFTRTKVHDGNYLYQGDILVADDPISNISKNTRDKRAVVAFDFFRWPNQRIPYKIHSSLNDNARRVILGAMSEWERSVPCIKFQVKSDIDSDFVHFFKGHGCFSSVGRSGGEQSLSIGAGCEQYGIALHEMGHALGIYHEQSRPDRDDYINIVKENILEGFHSQFTKIDKSIINSYNVPYDYDSIMHYSATAFAKKQGLVTIRAKVKRNVQFGQRDRLSDYDVKQARAMYGCEETDFQATPTTQTPSTSQPTTKLSIKETSTEAQTTSQPTTKQSTKETSTQTPSTSQPTTKQSTKETSTEVQLTSQPTTKESTVETSILTRITEKQTSAPITKIRTTEKITDALTTTGMVTKPTTVGNRLTSTTLQPSTNPRSGKDKACSDFLSTCFKWIRKGYCSRDSPNYCFMKYFCCCTCELWQKSELSRGATCVDLYPNCKARADKGHCSSLDDREYMENMCCHSCRNENCKDEDRFCSIWAGAGSCDSFSYMKKYCKKSCNFCD